MANRRPNSNETLEIWQWNCRTLHNKIAALSHFMQTAPIQPDIICIQELGNKIHTLLGYVYHTHPDHPKIATLVRKDIAVSVSYMSQTNIQHQILTIWPCKRSKSKTIIINIYSPPRERSANFKDLFWHAKSLARNQDKILILGDFNSPHTDWGYPRDSPKGRNLVEAMEDHNMRLVTILDSPTRTGNSVTRDTFPDLTFANTLDRISWTNLEENLGSDHSIISISVNSPKIRRPRGQATITDWKAYRQNQPNTQLNNAATWAEQIRTAYRRTTKKVALTDDVPAVDSHLLHLWEAKRSLIKRWKRQRHNRKLKLRIAKLSQEANEYAQHLDDDNWIQLCASMQGTLHTKKKNVGHTPQYD